MPDDAIVLKATLDQTQLELSLQKIEKRVAQMVRASDGRMKLLGKTTEALTEVNKGLMREYENLTAQQKEADKLDGGKKAKSFEAARLTILKTANALDGLIKLMRDMEDIDMELSTGGTVPVQRNEVRDSIEKQFASIRGTLLQDRLRTIMKKAEGTVKLSAKNMLKDLTKLMNDPTIKGKELWAEVKRITGLIDNMGEAARDATDIGGGRRVQVQETRAKDLQLKRGDLALGDLDRIIDQSKGKVRAGAEEMRESLIKMMKDGSADAKVLQKEIDGIEKEIDEAQQLAVKGITIDRGSRARDLQETRGQLVADDLTRLADKGVGKVQENAIAARAELVKLMKDPLVDAEKLRQEIDAIEKEIDQVQEQAREGKLLNVEAGAEGIGGRRDTLRDQRLGNVGRGRGQELEAELKRMMTSSQEIVREGATTINADLKDLLSTKDIGGEELLASVNKLKNEASQLGSLKPLDVIREEELSQLNLFNDRLGQLGLIAQEAAQLGSTETQQSIASLQKQAAAINLSSKSFEEKNKKIKTLISTGREYINSLKKQQKAAENAAEGLDEFGEEIDDFSGTIKKLDKAEGFKQLQANSKNANILMASNSKEAREIGQELKIMGKEAKDAFDKSEISAKQFNDRMKDIDGVAQRTGTAFGIRLPQSMDRFTVSAWKAGNAMDRIGVRGVGGAIRIADAFRGLPPIMLGVVVAGAAIVASFIKIIEVVTELAKKAATAFKDMVKGAVEAATSIQVTDVQLGSFLRAPELGRGYRKLLQERSVEVGLDLTRNFSRVIVPLAKDLDEVEKAADIAATMAHAFQETEEAISNAIKQAAGGHFRPLIQRFGLTEFEIDRIQDAQEVSGEFTGVLEGLQEALEMRGLDITSLSGSLQLLKGRFEVLKDQVLVTIGEPVRDELGQQLKNLFSLIDTEGSQFESFFQNLGETIASVIETAGGIISDFVGDIDAADMAALEAEVSELGGEISSALESLAELLGTDDVSLIDVFQKLTETSVDLVENLDEILQYLDGIGAIFQKWEDFRATPVMQFLEELGRVGKFIRPDQLIKDLFTGSVATNLKAMSEEGVTFNEAMANIFGTIGEGIPFMDDLVNKLSGGEIETWGEVFDENTDIIKENTEALAENADETEALINERQKLQGEMREYLALQGKAEDAQEKINEAEAKFARDRALREGQLRTRFDRQEIDQDIQRSQQREDLFSKHQQRLLTLTDDYHFKRNEAIEDFDEKEIDLGTKYQDKLADIDRKSAEKKIDIEKKFQEKLKDIRAKFDFDAKEAIRRNDAVALLRIRRRMHFELEQAKEARDKAEKAENDSADTRRDDAKIALDRGVRDNELAEDRKLADMLDADNQRRAQIIDQYNYEYGQIQTQYNRRRATIEENEQRAIEDLDKTFEARREDLDASLEAEYDLVDQWKSAEVDLMKLKLKEQSNLLKQQYQLWVREGSLFRNLIQSQTGYGSLQLESGESVPLTGGITDRQYVIGQVQSGLVTPYRQHGGFVTSGNIYGINERGAEPFYATRAGIIAPHDAMIGSPFTVGGQTSIDNSRHVNADIYANDPTQMNPIQRTMMRHIVTEELLNYGV